MQDRYAGDVGDFMKLSLLKTLAGTNLQLGINWYLTSGGPEGDGRHVTYLDPDNRIGKSLRQVDEDLYASLQPFAGKDADRSVRLLEQQSTLRVDTIFYAEPIVDRAHWHQTAIAKLQAVDLVFLDPDNGLRLSGADPNPHKHALPDEIRQYVENGKSVVLYHHADRSCSTEEQVVRRLDDVSAASGIDALAAVVARRGTVRFFLVVAQPEHVDIFARRLRSYHQITWGPSKSARHARVVWRDGKPQM